MSIAVVMDPFQSLPLSGYVPVTDVVRLKERIADVTSGYKIGRAVPRMFDFYSLLVSGGPNLTSIRTFGSCEERPDRECIMTYSIDKPACDQA